MLTIYTIGHSNFEADEFLMTLQQHGITVLVDVRSRPVSKYVPHFNKDALEQLLPANSIDYRYAGKYLGGQPDDPAVYRSGELPDDETGREQYLRKVDYLAVMERDWYKKGIERLLDIVRETQGNVVIMCSEGHPTDCHRHHMIARSLIDPVVKIVEDEVQVIHILRNGGTETVDPSVFPPVQLSLF